MANRSRKHDAQRFRPGYSGGAGYHDAVYKLG